MTLLNKRQKALIKTGLQSFSPDSPIQRIEDFVSSLLGLSSLKTMKYFPSRDDLDAVENLAFITSLRSDLLNRDCVVPTFVCSIDSGGVEYIEGLATALRTSGVPEIVCRRIALRDSVRERVRQFRSGTELEALGAAIIGSQLEGRGRGFATRRSHDFGVDVVGIHHLPISRAEFSRGSLAQSESRTSPRLFLIGSAKCEESTKSSVSLAPPAQVRELVGTWTIQRTSIGTWQRLGIRPLSPVVPIFITTYRLSDAVLHDCTQLGIEVWGIPQLVWLILSHAPHDVFGPDATNPLLDGTAFDLWWQGFDRTRAAPDDDAELRALTGTP